MNSRGSIYIGTSGWSYDWWRGTFYPESLAKARWLPYLASRLRTVEINYSFYRLPKRENFEKWRDLVDPEFVFAVKASRYITHNKKLKDAGEAWRRFHDAAFGLADKLGPILFEFPPAWGKDLQRLEEFLGILPEDLKCAFEFRHPSWFEPKVYRALDAKGASLVTSDSPRFPKSFEETGGFSFIRLHGGRVLYGSEYSPDELAGWAEHLLDLSSRGRDSYIYFNNDAFGFAPNNALKLKSLVEEARERKAA